MLTAFDCIFLCRRLYFQQSLADYTKTTSPDAETHFVSDNIFNDFRVKCVTPEYLITKSKQRYSDDGLISDQRT